MHRLFEKYVTKQSIVVECGAHIGTHTLKLAQLANHVYAFEPMPSTNKVLHINLLLNATGNVTVFQEGVSDASGSTTFCYIPNSGAACLDNNPLGRPPGLPPVETIHVPLRTIDSLNLDRLDFMKIDVEGYETLVIKGAMNTIRKYRPIIVMEVWSNHYGCTSIEHTKNTFKDLLSTGYNVVHVEGPDYLFTPV
jgi:FkbM family methyltransferase